MYRSHTVGVVLPAYNEAEHIRSVIEALPSFVDRVYAIDDCSTDGTWDVIREYATLGEQTVERVSVSGTAESGQMVATDGFGRPHPEVVPVRHGVNKGAGATIKTGYQLAERDGMDATVTIDADGQMDPGQMDRLLDPIVEGRAGFAKGNRLADAESAGGMPRLRLLGNWLLTLLMKPASGYPGLRDPQNGYTAISGDALSAVDIGALPDDHDYPNALLARLNVAGVSIADVPMAAIYGDEESTIDFGEFVRRTSVTILQTFLWRLRQASRNGRPHLTALYSLGILGVTVGTVSLASSTLQRWLPTADALPDSWSGTPLLLVGALAFLLAVGAEKRDDTEVVHE